jgi:hypothetical protein
LSSGTQTRRADHDRVSDCHLRDLAARSVSSIVAGIAALLNLLAGKGRAAISWSLGFVIGVGLLIYIFGRLLTWADLHHSPWVSPPKSALPLIKNILEKPKIGKTAGGALAETVIKTCRRKGWR